MIVDTHLHPLADDLAKYPLAPIFGKQSDELRFFPQFVLEAVEFNKAYLDRVLPAALR